MKPPHFLSLLVRRNSILSSITCPIDEMQEPPPKKEHDLRYFALFSHVFCDFLPYMLQRILTNPPPKKKCSKWGIESFFHTFFAISCHVRFNTCSYVMILYSKGNLMFLNTFLVFFWCQNHFCVLSATRNQNCSTKNRPKTPRIRSVSKRFFDEQF